MRRRRFGFGAMGAVSARGGVSFSKTVRCLAPVVGLAALASCKEIDTTRQQAFVATLGDDLYGVMCDRLGASSFAEDLSGESYQGLCHPTAEGVYENDVDESVLPPASGDGAKARAQSIAKMRAMARWRGDLVRAFNATFPDVEIEDVTTEASGDKVRLHDGLMKLGQALTPLYESNPFEEGGEPLFPSSTRAISRMLDSIAASDEAKAAFSRIWARQAYRPFKAGLGAVRSALSYPQLRDFTKASLAVLGPEGAAADDLQQLFRAAKRELTTSQPTDSPLAPFAILDANKAQPNRPRTTLEFAAGLFLTENDAYAEAGAPHRYIGLRDRRGFIVPVGNVPGQVGTVPSPFTDANSDGFADVDAFGRFLDGSGAPVAVDTPFVVPGKPYGQADEFGRPTASKYQYIDTSRTPMAAVARSLRVLADPGTEALMDALAGAHLLFGPREDARYDYTKDPKDAVLQPGAECPTVPEDACMNYRRFKGEESPLVDLIYAAGPLLADEDSDALLMGLLDLVENHEAEVARLLGAALKIRQISLDHDKLAAEGKEPLAGMKYEVPLWDQMAEILWHVAEEPRLLQKLVKGMGDSTLITPKGGAQHIGDTLSKFILTKDELTYNPGNVNGPGINLTDNAAGGSTADPKHPVDPTKPKTGKNRSLFERTLQLIHDVNRVKLCNKNGAKVFMDVFGGTVLPIEYGECELVQFDNLAAYYIDAVLADNHPKRAKMDIKADALAEILDLADQIGLDPNELFENSSGITGLTLTPTLPALNRLVFFGAESGLYDMPDVDPFIGGQNEYPNLFISNMLEPAPTVGCPKKPNGVNECADASGTLRVKGANTIFAWERFGFYDYLRPVVTPFAEVGCSEDLSICSKNDIVKYYRGEGYFLDLIDTLHQHWATDGGNTYEPILADAFMTDLFPALVEFSKVSTNLSKVTIQRGPKSGQVWTGADVLAKTAKILFSQDYAASIGLTDRKGNKATTWTDGTPQPQVTVFSLFADALHGLDVRFDTACATDPAAGPDCEADAQQRKAQWKAARSRLVDEFLTIDGEGPGAKFRNKATPKILASTLHLAREQVNANCANRENGGGCEWARKELPDKLARTLSGPMFAALMDVQEKLRADEPARKATEQLLVYLLSSDNAENIQAALASFVDLFQVLQGDADLSPIFRAIAPAAAAKDDPGGPGAGDTGIKVLLALTNDEYDPYHVMDHVLPAIVSPMEDGSNRAPLEIFIDAIADIHRIDADAEGTDEPLAPTDYATIFDGVRGFIASPTRGLEQFYFIVQNRPQQ